MNDEFSGTPPAEYSDSTIWLATKIIVFTLLILLALFGNLLVCIAICWDRQLRRQRDNLFLVSLAVSDLLVSVLVMVFAAVNDLQHRWTFGRLYCKLWISFDIMCCTCSILNLCAVALDRYAHISRPMIYLRYMNRRRIGLIIACVWVLSAGIGFAQLSFEIEHAANTTSPTVTSIATSPTSPTYHMTSSPTTAVTMASTSVLAVTSSHHTPASSLPSSSTQCTLELEPFYAIISSILSFFLPAALMVLLYTRLYLYARKHVRHIRRQFQAAASTTCGGVLLPQPQSHNPLHTTASLQASPPSDDDGLICVRGGSNADGARRAPLADCKSTEDIPLAVDRLGSPSPPPLWSAVAKRQSMERRMTSLSTASVPPSRRLLPSAAAAVPSGEGNCRANGVKSMQNGGLPSQTLQTPATNSRKPSFIGSTQIGERLMKVMKPAPHNVNVDSQAASEHKARVTLGVIMGTFLLCWAPFFVVNVLKPFAGAHVSAGLFQAVTWLGYANSTANPIIYSIFNRDFRRAFHRILTYRWRRSHDAAFAADAYGGGGAAAGSGANRSRDMLAPAALTTLDRTNGGDDDCLALTDAVASGHQRAPRRSQSMREPVETRVVVVVDGAGRLLVSATTQLDALMSSDTCETTAGTRVVDGENNDSDGVKTQTPAHHVNDAMTMSSSISAV